MITYSPNTLVMIEHGNTVLMAVQRDLTKGQVKDQFIVHYICSFM